MALTVHPGPEAFVGRESERARLAAVAENARQGRSDTLVLSGPPGQGKTALLDRLAADAADLRLLRATGVESEAALPFAALDALLRPLLGRLEEIPRVQAEALERALALGPGGPVERFAVGSATLSLIAAAADERPILCLVDDLQWIDEASRAALLFAARRLASERVGVVLAVRAEDAPETELRGLEQLRLGPQPAAEAHALLSVLGNGRVPDELATRLVEAADGNPLTLVELATRLTREQLEGREAVDGPPPPNPTAQALLAERQARLPERAREALLVVAASERSETDFVRAALEAAGLSLDALVPAEDAGLLQLRPGRLLLRHPLVRSVAYHEAPPEARRRAHRAIADALDPADERRPWHLAAAAAAPDADVAAALEQGAERARARGGYVAAGRARRRSAELTPEPAERARRLLDAGDDFEKAGLHEDARAVLGEAASATTDRVILARVRAVQASLLLRAGHPAEARAVFAEQLEVLEDGDPLAAARFQLQSAFASMLLGEVGAWERHARAALEGLDDRGNSNYRAGLALRSAALIADGRLAEAEPLLAEMECRLDAAHPDGEPLSGAVEVYGVAVRALIWVERWEDAERLLSRLIRDARALSALGALSYLLAMRAMLDGRRGRWTAAAAAAAEAIALAEETGEMPFLQSARAAGALLAAWRGDDEACRAAADAALAASPPPGWCHHALGVLALGRGDVEDAASRLRRLIGAMPDGGFAEPGSRPWVPDLIEALIRLGDRAAAERLLDRWQADGERTARAFALATAARCRALLCPDGEIDARFADALALHDGLAMPFERARTLLCHGERLRRARRRADARAPLREALASFEQLGARHWATRARTELRASGAMVPSAPRPQLEELTPHEIQVALLVAEGRTNREVAAALFLAPKTIEHHLTTIFRKLGVKRRTELARVFADELARRAPAD